MLFGDFDTVFALGVALNLSYIVFPQAREVIISFALFPIEDLIKEISLWFEDGTVNPNSDLHKATLPEIKTIREQVESIKQQSAHLAVKFSYISFVLSLLCIIFLYYCILKGQEEVTNLKFFITLSAVICFAPFTLFSFILWILVFVKGRALGSKLKIIKNLIENVKSDVEVAARRFEEESTNN